MAASGRNGRYITISAGRLLSEDANDDRRDVVVPTIDVCFLYQRVDDPLGFGSRKQELLDPPVIHHPRQTVASEQKGVAHPGLSIEHIGLDVVSHSDASCDDVALRVASRLFRSQQARIDLLLNQRMILRELVHLA